MSHTTECLACGDTGYEPLMPGYYCTFCKRGCAVARAQLAAGIDPWKDDEPDEDDDAEGTP
jgi:hypothetical protein